MPSFPTCVKCPYINFEFWSPGGDTGRAKRGHSITSASSLSYSFGSMSVNADTFLGKARRNACLLADSKTIPIIPRYAAIKCKYFKVLLVPFDKRTTEAGVSTESSTTVL